MAVPAAVLHVPLGLSRVTAPANLSPLSATLTSDLQLVENTSPLSPVFATLTRRVSRKSLACHSYKKTPGGYGSHCRARTFQPFNLQTLQHPACRSSSASTYPRWSNDNSNLFIHFRTLSRRNGVGGYRLRPESSALRISGLCTPVSFTGASRAFRLACGEPCASAPLTLSFHATRSTKHPALSAKGNQLSSQLN